MSFCCYKEPLNWRFMITVKVSGDHNNKHPLKAQNYLILLTLKILFRLIFVIKKFYHH